MLCVTHLPRSRPSPTRSSSVRKEERGGRTVAGSTLLLDDARVHELSRMLAGVGESAHARRHAAELLAGRARSARVEARRRLMGRRPHAARTRRRHRAASGPRTKDLARRIQPRRHRGHRPSGSRPRRGRQPGRGGRRRGRRTRPSRSRVVTRTRVRCVSSRPGIPLLDDVGPDGHGRGPRRRRDRAPRRRALARRREARRRAAPRRRDDRGAHGRRHAPVSAPSCGASRRTRSQYIEQEAELTFEPLAVPPLRTKIHGRHALVVVRGHDYQHDLRGAAAVHQRVPARAHRGRRRRRRAARVRVASPTSSSATSTRSPTARCTAAPSSCTTCTPTDARRVASSCVDAGRAVRGVRRRGHERGRRDAARVRGGRVAHRRGRNARDDGRVPRQGPPRHGVDVPHAPAARPRARRRQGREPALREPDPAPRPAPARRVGAARRGRDGHRVRLVPRVPRTASGSAFSDFWRTVRGWF